MTKAWITTSSTNVPAIVNSLNAACDQGFIPNQLHLLENPEVVAEVERALDVSVEVIDAYGGNEPSIHVTEIEDELSFGDIHQHVKNSIEDVKADDGEVAVDFTPGRKFMSAITFTAGMKYGADHVFYFYLKEPGHYGRFYPAIPRSAVELIDFTEELA